MSVNEVLILTILVLLSTFFSASETALTSVQRFKVRKLVMEKAIGAKALQYLVENPAEMLSTVLISSTLVNICASVLAGSIAVRYTSFLGSEGLAIGIATGIMAFIILVFAEITPKTTAIRNAEKVAVLVAPVILVFEFILRPVAFLLSSISKPFIIITGGRVPKKGPFITEEEIKMLVQVGGKEGVIEEEEREMITSIFEFGETNVREVMTPRPDIISIEVNEHMDNLIKMIVDTGHSRIPVYEGNMDNIVGVVYAKELLKAAGKDLSQQGIRQYLRPPLIVPEGKKVDDLLHEMQSARTHIAIIVDEHGDTAGLVSLEDLIEEIVGEIYDEFEKKVKPIEKVDENTVMIDGRLSIRDTNKLLKTNVPEKEEEYATISGFVFTLLGKIPAVGDTVRFSDLVISVERVHRRRITRLKITKLPKKEEEEFAGG